MNTMLSTVMSATLTTARPVNKNTTPTQSKFKSNKDRAAFKQECVGALAGIAAKYDVTVVFGPLTERSQFSGGPCKHGMARMELKILER